MAGINAMVSTTIPPMRIYPPTESIEVADEIIASPIDEERMTSFCGKVFRVQRGVAHDSVCLEDEWAEHVKAPLRSHVRALSILYNCFHSKPLIRVAT